MKKIVILFLIGCSCLSYCQSKDSIQQSPSQIKSDNIIATDTYFKSGLDTFKNLIISNKDLKKLSVSHIKATVKFIVERNGEIYEPVVECSDQEIKNRILNNIKEIKEKWIPAKVGDQIVRQKVRFYLP